MCPYFREEDVPEPVCEGSFANFGWEGAWNDRPKEEVVCPVCGVKLNPDFEAYETETKKGLFFMSLPSHYPGERL